LRLGVERPTAERGGAPADEFVDEHVPGGRVSNGEDRREIVVFLGDEVLSAPVEHRQDVLRFGELACPVGGVVPFRADEDDPGPCIREKLRRRAGGRTQAGYEDVDVAEICRSLLDRLPAGSRPGGRRIDRAVSRDRRGWTRLGEDAHPFQGAKRATQNHLLIRRGRVRGSADGDSARPYPGVGIEPSRVPVGCRPMPSALITGITGQDGLYLSQLLIDKGYDVYGLIRGQNNPKRDLVHATVPAVTLLTGDLTDLSSLMRAMEQARPDEVYNLGAISFVAYSWENAMLTTDVTGKGVLNALEAVRLYSHDDPSKVRFYQASSSEMFGKVQEVPQKESTLLWPRSPYGVAKVFGHYMTINYRESYGMHASSGILFNHESPRRGPEFVTRKISIAVARIALGMQQTVSLGNLDARRDWGFAGDYVDAMWRMLQQPEGDDYVVATGETHSIREFLDLAFRQVGIDDWEKHVVQDPRFFRPAEVDVLIGDPSKARKVLGWQPSVDFRGLVTMMVDNDLAIEGATTQVRS
jgi:GDPmannose 4,6-dehydratase